MSTNERAERVMGRRLTPEQESGEAPGVVPFDMPTELGYQCPVHRTGWDEGLQWSEYAGFLWCARCDRDYPSPLCVPMDRTRDHDWEYAGPDDAVGVFLDVAEMVAARAAHGQTEGASDGS